MPLHLSAYPSGLRLPIPYILDVYGFQFQLHVCCHFVYLDVTEKLFGDGINFLHQILVASSQDFENRERIGTRNRFKGVRITSAGLIWR